MIARLVKQRAAAADAAGNMAGDRHRYGLLLGTLGAVLVAVAVFLPWYGVSVTARGLADSRQLDRPFAARHGNTELHGHLGEPQSSPAASAGRQLDTLSAHQALSNIGVALLVLAGLALLDSLFGLVRASGVAEGSGASLVLLGTVAAACVVYRLLHPPTPAGGLLALSLREGGWVALVGSLMMLVGGLRPRVPAPAFGEELAERAWPGLSGWTPQR